MMKGRKVIVGTIGLSNRKMSRRKKISRTRKSSAVFSIKHTSTYTTTYNTLNPTIFTILTILKITTISTFFTFSITFNHTLSSTSLNYTSFTTPNSTKFIFKFTLKFTLYSSSSSLYIQHQL